MRSEKVGQARGEGRTGAQAQTHREGERGKERRDGELEGSHWKGLRWGKTETWRARRGRYQPCPRRSQEEVVIGGLILRHVAPRGDGWRARGHWPLPDSAISQDNVWKACLFLERWSRGVPVNVDRIHSHRQGAAHVLISI